MINSTILFPLTVFSVTILLTHFLRVILIEDKLDKIFFLALVISLTSMHNIFYPEKIDYFTSLATFSLLFFCTTVFVIHKALHIFF